MSIAKDKRPPKRQKGQFLTPRPLACEIIRGIELRQKHKVLEPSMGDGSFILPLIHKFMKLYRGSVKEKLEKVLHNNIYGVELDESLYARCLQNIKNEWGELPSAHHLRHGDFLLTNFGDSRTMFDYVIGNPPFGGTINPVYQDALDKQFGFRGGTKIKKETYSFFIVKSAELLQSGGRLIFICSDTFLTINTMKGLRDFLLANGKANVDRIPYFSDEISQQTALLKFIKGATADGATVDGRWVSTVNIHATPNHSWQINNELVKYFCGPNIGDFMTASSGMTVGKNEYFVRDIIDGSITEPRQFSFYQKPITLADAIARARLGHISPPKQSRVLQQESRKETIRDIHIQKRAKPKQIAIPHSDYCYYNKARKGIIYAPPAHVIFWRDDGDAVYTYKQNGNWYLNGVGGKKYFFCEGLTWNLIATRPHLRYLPQGYVLDSGAPCAFLKHGIDRDEMFFILAWGLTDLCRDILKNTINHTKNIQGKDLERLPYPFWLKSSQKSAVIARVKTMIESAKMGRQFNFMDNELREINAIFSDDTYFRGRNGDIIAQHRQQLSLIATAE